ncbi:hypothetical protein [Branchiibius sp. NY16-3462-2]|uniref:hypothetical protein n=1 Tax=Branchiibius sp. NY16-3462-2 TaxID=1807500 RepID=UPI0007980FAF|nr:hypothetical protein [Branchiibius sp. NY16-3462-2]KYH45227.1 hypothetical protein AZH51_15275 [Branchiibius sp. NY16-3462-2]
MWALFVGWTALVVALTWWLARGSDVRRSRPDEAGGGDVFAEARDVLSTAVDGTDPELPARVGRRQSFLGIQQQARTQAAAAAIVQGHQALRVIPGYLRRTADDDGVTPEQRFASIVQAAQGVLQEAEAASFVTDTTTLRALEKYAKSHWSQQDPLDLDPHQTSEVVHLLPEEKVRTGPVVVTGYRHSQLIAAARELARTGRPFDARQLQAWTSATTRSEQEAVVDRAQDVMTACRQQQLSWGDGRVQEAMFRLREALVATMNTQRPETANLADYQPDWLCEVILTLGRTGDRDVAAALTRSREWLTAGQEVSLAHDAQRLDRICRQPAQYPPGSRKKETAALVEQVEQLREQTRRARR